MKKDNFNDIFREKCREKGLKVTPQRTLIYEVLSEAKDHPSADAIYKRVRKSMPNISFDTVYRTLLSFTEMGIVSLVEGYGEQKRFEPNDHNHHHCRCVKCRAIIDFCNDSYDSIQVPPEISGQFQVISKRVVLEGLCSKCKAK